MVLCDQPLFPFHFFSKDYSVKFCCLLFTTTQDIFNVTESSAESKGPSLYNKKINKRWQWAPALSSTSPSNCWQKWKMEHIDTRMQIVQGKEGEKTSSGPLLPHLRWFVCIFWPNKYNNGWDCFRDHAAAMKQSSNRNCEGDWRQGIGFLLVAGTSLVHF